MTGGIPGFGGQGYVSQETRALSSISDDAGPDLSQGQEQQVEMLQRHDYQIKFLAGQMKQAQQGINEANQNPIQQLQQFVADIIVLLGGGELANGLLDFGDLQYILPAIGALFGFGDGPFPLSLFEAAQKFFLGYVVPQQQFVDVINHIIEAWMGIFGIDKKFVHDVQALITAVSDLFGGIANLFPSLNELFGALGISGAGGLGPFGQLLGSIMRLFGGFNLSGFGNIIDFITAALDPWITGLTAVINWINSILAIFGFHGGHVVNSPLGDLTKPFENLWGFLGHLNFFGDFDIGEAWTSLITTVMNPLGVLQDIFARNRLRDIIIGIGNVLDDIPLIGDDLEAALLRLFNIRTKAVTAEARSAQIVADVTTAWADDTPEGAPTAVYGTISAIRTAVFSDYTVETIPSSTTWTKPPGTITEFYAVAATGGSKGMPGQGAAAYGTSLGGANGKGSVWKAAQIDPAQIPDTVACTVGTAAASNGAFGQPTSFGSLLTAAPGGNGGIATPQGWMQTSSRPGDGGTGGNAVAPSSGSNSVTAGTAGESTASATGGPGGTGRISDHGNNGQAGEDADNSGMVKSGGAGGGGGGGSVVSWPSGTNTGGRGGDGGYPGGSSGGGGGARNVGQIVSGVFSGDANGGQPGTPANGALFLIYKLVPPLEEAA